jgi:tetratricopeptide (TPR) repeat protein
MNARNFAALPLLLLLLCADAAALGQMPPEPKLTPVPSTEQQTAAVREGVVLHDRGDYEGAIRKYEAVLAENPANVLALYEMSFAYSAKKDHRKALELALRGAQYKSELLSGFYVLIGNTLDVLGEPGRAIEVYKKGIKLFPGEGQLHFNLGITYRKAGKVADARKSFKAAAAANPQHASSHLLLAAVLHEGGYRTPSLLAAARFLALEPSSQRSAVALKVLHDGLRGGASPGKNPNEINLTFEADPKKDEGDFSAVDMFIGLSAAAGLTEEGQKKTEAQRIVEQVGSLFTVLGEQDARKKQSSFAHRFYVPYFVEMKRKGHAEAFVYHALQSSGLPGVREWIDGNGGRVMQFLIWSKGYEWPSDVSN